VNVEKLLDQKVWGVLGAPKPRCELPVKGVRGAVVKHYRLDALYGLAVLEHKRPGALGRPKDRGEAVKKVKDEHIPALLQDRKVKEVTEGIKGRGLTPRVAGVTLDGFNVVSVDCLSDEVLPAALLTRDSPHSTVLVEYDIKSVL
jgi:hypothetical protein